jgi:hypothetical protein
VGFALPAFFAHLAVLAAFFVGVAFFPDFALDGATRGFRGAAVGFVAAFGCSAVA